MDPDFWRARWERCEIGFNQRAPHGFLAKHGPSSLAGRVMAPLCGKSVDMLWLRAAGHEVAGIELSAIACEAFFAENAIPVERRREGAFDVFRADGITLWCGDLFDAPDAAWEGIGSVYDRAALVALPPPLRARYAAVVGERARAAGAPILLVTYEHPRGSGPPFSVSEDEVRRLYAGFAVRRLESVESDLRGAATRESAYLLEPA